ncbi:MAG: trypsin-like peptidase domain-containing protein, partial [Proteobacteria bacterium]|nr:trypsin-like peptidase domain-containing protein [Pseudomonadota bacterium]
MATHLANAILAARRSHRATGRLAAAVLLLVGLPLTAAAAAPVSYAALVSRAAPSVVTVLVTERGEDAGQRAAERARADAAGGDLSAILSRLAAGGANPGGAGPVAGGLGSGFVIRSDGLIVTNRHVVAGARSIRVRLPGGREVPARLVGVDATTDLALLSVSAGTLPALTVAPSSRIAIGDPVVAIGNPFGLGQTVTAGILSARGRVLEDDPYIDFLQTDAPINFGNSGGPLLALDGTVIGVTSAIVSPSGGSVGLGFAIPSETVTAVVNELEAKGVVSRGFLGVS